MKEEQDLKILIGLNRTVIALNKKTAQLCHQYGLTLSQFGVLEVLYHKGDLTIGEVKERILSSDGTIPVVVKNLEKSNLIERLPHPSDRRCTLLHLTEQGKERIKQVFPKNKQQIEKEMSVWTEAEKQAMIKLLKKFGNVNTKKT